ncbi:MAG: hypothetical protein QY309_00380 [Cyclobacteriaceae bacterium]|nr:MAG: hypothetical protein QY309_00380 [Cyclobacteriaceae bacterium]
MREFFGRKMVGKTDYELKSIVERRALFQAEAVLAAIDELERRNLPVEDTTKIKVLDSLAKEEIKHEHQDEEVILFPNTIIVLVCSLISPAISGIPYAINLWRIGKKNEIWIASAVLIIFNFGEVVLARTFPWGWILWFPLNFLAAVAMVRIFHFLAKSNKQVKSD